MAESFEITINEVNRDLGCLELLQQTTGLSRGQLKQAVDKGALWLGRGQGKKQHIRRLRRVKSQLQLGDQLFFYHNPEILSQTTAAAELVAALDGYSLWYKPSGMLCQGSKWSDHCTITRSVEKQRNRNAYLVHRLDRATCGLILIGESKQATAKLAEMFRQRNLSKHYQAIVKGKLEQSLSIEGELDGKTAISHITPISYDESSDCSLLSVKIDTGRKHQIRRQLSAIGHPIVGDRLYGDNQTDAQPDLQLCAYRLEFQCPLSGVQQRFVLAADKQLRLPIKTA